MRNNLIYSSSVLNSFILKKFCQLFLKQGKKHKVEKLLFNVFKMLNKEILLGCKGLFIIYELCNYLKFPLELLKKRKGRKYFNVFFLVDYFRQVKAAIRRVKLNFRKAILFKKSFIFSLYYVLKEHTLNYKNSYFKLFRIKYLESVYESRNYTHYRWYSQNINKKINV